MTDNSRRGLYHKFIVSRTDGRDGNGDKHPDCRYFVLDLDHDDYALIALSAYADACEGTHPNLAFELQQTVASRLQHPADCFQDLMDADEGDRGLLDKEKSDG